MLARFLIYNQFEVEKKRRRCRLEVIPRAEFKHRKKETDKGEEDDEDETPENTDDESNPEVATTRGELYENPNTDNLKPEPGSVEPFVKRKKRNKKKNKKEKNQRRSMICYDDDGQEIEIGEILRRSRRQVEFERSVKLIFTQELTLVEG